MRHLFVAALMVVGALLVTATTAGVLQSRATSGNNVGSYEPPSLTSPQSKTAKAPSKSAPEPAVIGVRGRSNAQPRTAPAVLDQRV
ncbi:MAG: hypothetical protein KIT25_20345 [Enhydrobacter sp.]|nr:MAG: hypothetical protein KIT25_20345 [Enhydrobacter sp.]